MTSLSIERITDAERPVAQQVKVRRPTGRHVGSAQPRLPAG
jgi:hypothetical protein